MTENSNNDILNTNQQLQPLPNSTASLVLGILSIVICGPGLIMGIIGIVLANKDITLYKSNPGFYTEGSYNNLKAGRICSIIGILLSGALILFYLGLFVFAFFVASKSIS